MITIIGAPWCGPCQAIKKKLDKAKVDYKFINVDDTPNGWDLVETLSGRRAIPCITYKFRSPREFYLAMQQVGLEAFDTPTTQPKGKTKDGT